MYNGRGGAEEHAAARHMMEDQQRRHHGPQPSDPYRYDGGEDDRHAKNFNTSEFAKEASSRSRGSRYEAHPADGAYYARQNELPHNGRAYNEYKRDGGRANYYAGSTSLLPSATGATESGTQVLQHTTGSSNNFTL